MWYVKQPDIDAGKTFATCISRVREPEKEYLLTIRPHIEKAATKYAEKAQNGELHLLPQERAIGTFNCNKIIKIYKNNMVKKESPGRQIYDQLMLLPEDERCPFCNHGMVSSLDHILPKSKYPIFAVTPINLVACCSYCNQQKKTVAPTDKEDSTIHPYFEHLEEFQWLGASVVEKVPAAIIFHTIKVNEWGDVLNARILHQFNLLELAKLYSRQAACEITSIRYNLNEYFKFGGFNAVRSELKRQWKSRKVEQINSWQTATYEALANSDWFCEKGFTLKNEEKSAFN